MYKYLLFDLDDTVLDFEKTENNAIKRVLKKFDIEPSDVATDIYHEINAKGWQKCEKGELSKAELFATRFDEFFKQIGVTADGKLAEEAFEEYLKDGVYFMPEAKRVLKQLYKDYCLILVSNGIAKTQEIRLKNAKIKKYFKGIFVSGDIGFSKPDKNFFDYVLKKMKIEKKEECLIIGNGIYSDVAGGKNSGIDTCWYNFRDEEPDKNIKPTYIINNLEEIVNLL